jgi:hypothetical protein
MSNTTPEAAQHIIEDALVTLNLPAYTVQAHAYTPRRPGSLDKPTVFVRIPDWQPNPRWNDLVTLSFRHGFVMKPGD